ncbi:hypothetical protein GCM10022216_31020 [Sphingobacterium kyonggiense]|uniref:Uncharacterized protein n=1 Tax=Sphingobacterium kyonggiense TaxID=714075 RepID=A0ABP7Z2X5_9SPHI
MNSERIVYTFDEKPTKLRYAYNKIRSFCDYDSLYLKHVSEYGLLSHIKLFIHEKVISEQISKSYQKGLIGVIKKLY